LAALLPATQVGESTSDAATSLLPIVLPARDVRSLPNRLADAVEARLKSCGVSQRVIQAEIGAMVPVVVGPTIDRSVLGIMVDFAKSVPYHLEPGSWNELDLRRVEAVLAETPCYAGREFHQVIFPDKKAPEVLNAKWMPAS
jgi:hypothetical protein